MTISPRQRCVTALVCGAALIAVALPARSSAAVRLDDFFDSELDGFWSGTITVNKQPLPMQLTLNVEPSGGAAYVVLPNADDDAIPGTTLFEATVTSNSATKVTLTFNFEDPIARNSADSTITLTHDTSSDTLSGKLAGDARGDITLLRGDPGVPLQRLWEGNVNLGEGQVFVILGLTEDTGTARFAANTVGGTAVIGGESGDIEGERNGSTVTLTAKLASGDVQFDLKSKKKNNQLAGQAESSSGARIAGIKLLPSGGDGKGKALKVKKATPKEVQAGATTSVKIKGAGFGDGTLAYSDNRDVEIGAVTADSTKQLRVEVIAGTDASGAASIRVVSSDGQVAEKNNLLTIASDGGGGGGVSFAASVQPIFTNSCALAGCHSAASGAAGLVLASGSAFANLVGVPSSQQPSMMRIAPNDAESSYLVRKIRGDSGITGGRMPLNRTPLSADEINTIVTWANEGAANNRLPR